MSDEHHIHSQLKHVLVNNWNYTEYIPVVPLYLIENYVSSTLSYQTSDQHYFFFPILTIRTIRECISCNLIPLDRSLLLYIYLKMQNDAIAVNRSANMTLLRECLEYFFSDIFQPIKRKLYECPLHGWSFSKLSFYCT